MNFRRQRRASCRKATVAGACLALAMFSPACDSGEEEGHDSHDSHGGTGDADTMVQWHNMPPMMMTAGEAVDVMWTIHTHGELHITEVRACAGQDEMCGEGEMDSFDVNFAATEAMQMYTASITLDTPGDWTIVAYAHVGPDPFVSPPVMVTVQ